MSSAFVDGALKGFNMMERHKARKAQEQRLSMLDKRNESRYQDQQRYQLAQMNKNDARYQDQQDRLARLEQLEASRYQEQKNHRSWQRQRQERAELWAQDQQALGLGWDYFRENGEIAPEHEEMFARNKGYSPTTFLNPDFRSSVKALGTKVENVLKTGNTKQINDPETLQLFDSVFKDKFAQSVGEIDPETGATISDVSFAGFVPTERDDKSVSFALQVTYDDGTSMIKPMSQGRTTDPNDPVLTMSPKELIGTIKAKVMMADMIERPDYWDQLTSKMGGGTNKTSNNGPDKKEAAYRKELALIERDLTNAIAKIQGDTNMVTTDADRQKSIDRVKEVYQSRKQALADNYGMSLPRSSVAENQPSKPDNNTPPQTEIDYSQLSDDELMQQLSDLSTNTANRG